MPQPQPSFRRNQIEWAIWRLISDATKPPTPVSETLKIRITRLLELDRDPDLGHASHVPHMRYAFIDSKPPGRGGETEYSAFNVFCLALALDLLEFGFKQSEVVFLLRHIRSQLHNQFNAVLASPPVLRQLLAPEVRPDCPTHERNGTVYADCRRYMVIERIDLDTVAEGISVLEPTYCRGIEGLSTYLDQMNVSFRKALVFELAEMVVELGALLEAAPVVRRGRPPKLRSALN